MCKSSYDGEWSTNSHHPEVIAFRIFVVKFTAVKTYTYKCNYLHIILYIICTYAELIGDACMSFSNNAYSLCIAIANPTTANSHPIPVRTINGNATFRGKNIL